MPATSTQTRTTLCPTRGRSAAETVLIAAWDLGVVKKLAEFSEWDLTVAAWTRDRETFGMRGYSQTYPDHKRVSMEIMGGKASSILNRGYLTRLRPNTYSLTSQGRVIAAATLNDKAADQSPEVLAFALRSPAFAAWQRDPSQPHDWAEVEPLFGSEGRSSVLAALTAASLWCRDNESLIYQPHWQDKPIDMATLAALLDFVTAMGYRFARKLGRVA